MAGAGTAALFDRLAGRYDAWFDGPAGAAVFPSEAACLRPLLAGLPRPWAEVGTGSGRFAAALGADIGLDPAARLLALARSRGVRVVRGDGDLLPFRDGAFGAVLVVVTLCFADHPAALLAEARRAVRGDGAVILGTVFADSPWGGFYRRKAADGHPFYSAARFLTRSETLALVTRAGLRVQAARSVLYQSPSDAPVREPARDGDDPAAGFSCWRAVPDTPRQRDRLVLPVLAPGRRTRPGSLFPQVLKLAANQGKLLLEVFQVVFQIPGAGPPAAPGVGRIGRAGLVTRGVAEAAIVRVPVSMTAAHVNLPPCRLVDPRIRSVTAPRQGR